MPEFFEKKLHSTNVFRIILLALLIAAFGIIASIGLWEEKIIAFTLFLALAFVWLFCVALYWEYFLPFTSMVRRLREKGMLDIANDIQPEKPKLSHPKVYYGRRALFSDKAGVIIPYAEIAWVYVHETKNKHHVTVERSIMIHTKEGKRFSVTADVNVFQRALQDYMIACSPNVVIGYGAEQKARYEQLNPGAAAAEKRVQVIRNIVLAAVIVAILLVWIFTR